MVIKINPNESQDKHSIEKETLDVELLDFKNIPFPKTDNTLHLILYSLNKDIADFYTLFKFTPYLPKNQLHTELLRKSMNINRNFAFLFLNTKSKMMFLSPEYFDRAEKLLFKEEVSQNCITYTHKLCRSINNYKMALHKEGYLPRLRESSLSDDP
jgi:hypothetical protein